jgi:hypothetical protein
MTKTPVPVFENWTTFPVVDDPLTVRTFADAAGVLEKVAEAEVRVVAFIIAAFPLVKTFRVATFIPFTYADPNGLVSFPIFEEPAIFGKRLPDNIVDVLRTTKFPKINEFPVETTSPK